MTLLRIFISTIILMALLGCVKPNDIVEKVKTVIPGGKPALPEETVLSSLDGRNFNKLEDINPEEVGIEGNRSIDGEFVDEELISSSDSYKVNNKYLYTYVNQIASTLILSLPGEQRPEYEIFITYDNNIRAHATFQKQIYITSATLLNINSEDELAFLLSHELSHLILKHNQYSVERAKQRKMFGDLRDMAIGLVQLSNLDVESLVKKGEVATKDDEKLGKQVKKVSRIGKRVLQVKKGLIDPSYNRKEEQEADYLAIDMMLKSGYNPKGLYRYMDVVKAFRKDITDTNERRTKAIDEAQDSITQYVNKISKERGIDTEELKSQLKQDIINVVVGAVEGYLQKYKNSHFNPDVRKSLAKDYKRYFYKKQKKTKLKVDRFKHALAKSNLANSVADLTILSEIEADVNDFDSGDKKDLARLSTRTLSLMRGSKKEYGLYNNSYSWIVLAKIRDKQNRESDVISNLETAMDMKSPHPSAYSLLMDLYLKKKQYDDAKVVLDSGYDEFENDAIFSPQSSRVAFAFGNEDEAKKYDDKCQKQYQGKRNKHSRNNNVCLNMSVKNKVRKNK